MESLCSRTLFVKTKHIGASGVGFVSRAFEIANLNW
jgi:hypothetical protein